MQKCAETVKKNLKLFYGLCIKRKAGLRLKWFKRKGPLWGCYEVLGEIYPAGGAGEMAVAVPKSSPMAFSRCG